MININIFDETNEPIQITEECSEKDMLDLMTSDCDMILLYDCKTKTTFSIPKNKYVIS